MAAAHLRGNRGECLGSKVHATTCKHEGLLPKLSSTITKHCSGNVIALYYKAPSVQPGNVSAAQRQPIARVIADK